MITQILFTDKMKTKKR